MNHIVRYAIAGLTGSNELSTISITSPKIASGLTRISRNVWVSSKWT